MIHAFICKTCVQADLSKHPHRDPIGAEFYVCPVCGKHWSTGGRENSGDVVAHYYPEPEKKKATKKEEKS